MIPLTLTIEGLYSYQERQTIDFTELASNGLFGILGGVGSGKSSILEAITYALYGETERLNSRDRRGYNMMNLKSDRLYVEFDFMNHENNIFRATREIKRNSKDFEVVRPATVQFYEQKGDGWIPLEHSNAEEIIGLSYANFKRTIIIPQGQFKEFLELGPTDRTTMMKDIFQLHKYDLQYKASALNVENKTKLDQIEGRLMEFESVNVDDIKSKSDDLSQLEEEVNEIKREHELINQRYQRLRSLKDDFVSLQSYKNSFSEKLRQQEFIIEKQKNIDIYERAFAKFDRLLSDISRENKLLTQLMIEHSDESKYLSNNITKLEEKQKRLNEILPYYNVIPQKRNEEADLELIMQIIDFNSQIETYKVRTQKGEAMMEEVNSDLEKTLGEINRCEEIIKELSKHKFDSQLLLDIDGWYLQNDNITKLVAHHERALAEKQNELSTLLKEIEDNNIDIVNFEKIYDDAIMTLNNREKEATEHKTNFELQQKMADYANALHHGEACPLCGSKEHPHIAGVEDVSHHIKEMKEELAKIKSEMLHQQNYRSRAQRMSDRSKEFNTQINDAKTRLDAEITKLNDHKKLFIWTDFKPDDKASFDERKKQSISAEKEIASINKQISKFRKDESELRNNMIKYSKALDEFKRTEAELSTKIASNISYLKVLKFEDYKEHNIGDITKIIFALKEKNDSTERQYNILNSDITNIDKTIASQKTSVDSLLKRIKITKDIVSELTNDMESKLNSEGYESAKIVEDILSQKIDIAKERAVINKFTIEFETLKNQIKDLEDKLAKEEYDNSKFEEQEIAWHTSKHKLDESNNRMIKLKSDLERLNKLLAEKKELIKEQELLSKRADNLRIMTNLFKAQGFVQYVSSIYLAQLCDHANERFRRMTRNQLRLQINENNDFEIVDYLNEGRSRSVKTLSGGQAFQVSLSLALALAESVQTNAKADKNFFFIDEGFGTQDSDSVNIVFETLLNLNKENKIVGIISHVEELKERIPMTLTVIKDQERGSLIR